MLLRFTAAVVIEFGDEAVCRSLINAHRSQSIPELTDPNPLPLAHDYSRLPRLLLPLQLRRVPYAAQTPHQYLSRHYWSGLANNCCYVSRRSNR